MREKSERQSKSEEVMRERERESQHELRELERNLWLRELRELMGYNVFFFLTLKYLVIFLI